MAAKSNKHKKTAPKIEILDMIKACSISRLKIWERNPRENGKAVEAVERSLSRFGPVAPIIVDEEYRICAGETRYKAALKSGRKTFPVIVCRFPDESSFVGYNIADNQTASIAEWDVRELVALIKEAVSDQIAIEDIGFDEKSFADLLAQVEKDNAIDLDDSEKEQEERETAKCPKCGFEFEL